jgi:hypothetical protein
MVSRRVMMAAAVHSHHSRRSMRRNAARGSVDRAKPVCSRLFGGSRFKYHRTKPALARSSVNVLGAESLCCSWDEPSKLFLHELIQVCASFPLAWTASKLLHVQEDTVFRKVRQLWKVSGACAIMGGESRFGTGPRRHLLGLVTRPEETMESARDRVFFRSGKPMRCRRS